MTEGFVTAVNGNMVSVQTDSIVTMNEVAYIVNGDNRLKSEVIRIRGNSIQVQVYEITKGIKVGNKVEFTNELLSVELGPGLLGQIYDGLQNPLPEIAAQVGYFLQPGLYLNALPRLTKWHFTPTAKLGDTLQRGMSLGWVPERHFQHHIMLPLISMANGSLKALCPKATIRWMIHSLRLLMLVVQEKTHDELFLAGKASGRLL